MFFPVQKVKLWTTSTGQGSIRLTFVVVKDHRGSHSKLSAVIESRSSCTFTLDADSGESGESGSAIPP